MVTVISFVPSQIYNLPAASSFSRDNMFCLSCLNHGRQSDFLYSERAQPLLHI